MFMSSKTNFGDTLTSGIQDVSALLPLLGTEQCERHVGSALEKGFLYAAVAPLSIFGSLGVIKTTFATLLATITFPFYGSRWLDDAGFGTPGSVSSMVTIAKGSTEYGAEVNLVKLFKDQHIDDFDLVEDVEWSGWQKFTESQPDLPSNLSFRHWWIRWISMSWNTKLIATSALAALISVSPYLYLISSDWVDPLFWLFPILRALGSFLCVMAIQLALQLRIHHIIRGRLLLMKATKSYLKHQRDGDDGTQAKSPPECEWDANKKDILEQRLRKLSKHSDFEKGAVNGGQTVDHQKLADVLSINWLLIAYQLIMAIGMPMIVVGYVGCFNLVSQGEVAGGPYVWLGIEAMLSVLRLALWGWNPKWDEGTGMKIKLKLSRDTPPITTPYSLRELEQKKRPQKYSFLIISENNFLATATRFTGPLQRFVSSTVSLFYSLVADDECRSKLLFTTILNLHTRTTQTFYIGKDGLSKLFSSTWKLDPRTNAIRVTLGEEIKRNESHQDNVFNQVLDHSKYIASRLCGSGCINALDLQWTVSYSSPKSDLSVSEIVMDDRDRKYVGVGNQFINKTSFCSIRDSWTRDYMYKWEATWRLNEWTELGQGIEALHLLESVVLEKYLCSKVQAVQASAQELISTDSYRFFAEWVHEMKCRMAKEKEVAMKRFDEWKMHDDVKQRIIRPWEKASKMLESHWQRRGVDLAEIVTILDGEDFDMKELVSTIFGHPHYSDCWPSNVTSERVQRALVSQFRWFLRRLKTVLQDGIPSDPSMGKSNYAEDLYLDVYDASAHVLDSIRLNPSLRIICFDRFRFGKLSTSDINEILKIVADKDTLTTLYGSKSILSADMLKNNHHILFLPGVTCQQPCTTEHPLCALVHRNRQEWRESARSAGSDVTYTVGFTSFVVPKGDEMQLRSDTECLIMVYTKSSGRLKLSLHHRRHTMAGLSLDSLCIFLRSGETVGEWKEVHSISKQDIPERYADKPHEIVTPEVAAGYHEIRIQIIEGLRYHLHSATVARCESNVDSRSEDV